MKYGLLANIVGETKEDATPSLAGDWEFLDQDYFDEGLVMFNWQTDYTQEQMDSLVGDMGWLPFHEDSKVGHLGMLEGDDMHLHINCDDPTAAASTLEKLRAKHREGSYFPN